MHLEDSRSCLEPSGAVVTPSGAFLGSAEASRGLLECSWSRLGASWSGLLGVCCHKVIVYNFLDRFWVDLEAQMGPQRSPKWSSKSIKIEHENNDKI